MNEEDVEMGNMENIENMGKRIEELREELEEVKKMVLKWFEGYKSQADEMAVEMFIDDLDVVDPYVRRLYDIGAISRDEYLQFLSFCDKLVDELKKLVGIETIDWRFR